MDGYGPGERRRGRRFRACLGYARVARRHGARDAARGVALDQSRGTLAEAAQPLAGGVGGRKGEAVTAVTQAEYWNTAGAARWVQHRAAYDALFHAHGEVALDAAALRDGDAVLDVGCGCGATTLSIAARVAPGGHAVGVDISAPMIDIARKRAVAAGLDNLRFEVGDAQSCALDEPGYDVVTSRLGIMFFEDPEKAFARLRRATRKHGRFAAVCWRDAGENPWITLPLEATSAFLPTAPIDPSAPGPFSLSRRERIASILRGAGFSGIAVDPLDLPLLVGRRADEAATLMVDLGPVGRALFGAPTDVRRRAVDAIAAALEARIGARQVELPSAAWLVTARAE